MKKPVAKWILIALAAGVVINVPVALLCTNVGHLWPGDPAPVPAPEVAAIQNELRLRGASTRVMGGRAQRHGYSELRLFLHENHIGTDENYRLDMHVTDADVIEVHAGWPMKSFQYRLLHRDTHGVLSDERRLMFSRRLRTDPWQERRDIVFPTTPIRSGIVWNSLVYAAIVFAAIVLLRFNPVRRRLRLKRGLCPRCAYPIGVSPRCTECGEPLPAAAPPSVAK